MVGIRDNIGRHGDLELLSAAPIDTDVYVV